MIIWIASYPRSGNSWFRAILRQSFNFDSVEIYRDIPLADRPRWLEQAARESTLHFVKTHDLPGKDTSKAVYVIRDGRDALVSYTWFHLQIDKNKAAHEITPQLFHQTLKGLIEAKKHPFGTWSTNVDAWRKRPNTVIVSYEEMLKAPVETAARVLAQCGITAKPQAAAPTFAEMKAQYPVVVRRGQSGSWRDEFPPDLLPLFWKIHGPTMDALGYSREDTLPGKGRAAQAMSHASQYLNSPIR